ncbi:DUF3710 domain-containing protein [Bifidobacterium choerinum]|uniref:Cytosolic protein n=1 Tax=Bifidobacterium choerinum TaxID=35760 RepID=A0A087AB43_9BIFI|nr:DUF3710 domain-containing protein [Bifidobacterium choerinum]KFI55993.1 cytosolic protein [Bifidobacterium choerinum]
MGLFGFGRKKKEREAAKEREERLAQAVASQTEDVAKEDADDIDVTAAEQPGHDREVADEERAAEAKAVRDDESEGLPEAADAEDGDEALAVPTEAVMDYQGRGEQFGPWDISEDNGPDYDEYLSLGSFYIPFVQGIQLRLKASKADNTLLGATVTIGRSSLELEAFAAPKTMGLWDDVRDDLVAANPAAKVEPGIFGAEVRLPIQLPNGKKHITRIIGVDGPRWMLRGIFSGPAADDPDSPEAKVLDRFFSYIVVDRGEEPLAPRDLIPMAQPLTPGERRAMAEAADGDDTDDAPATIDGKPTGPMNSDHEVEQKTTLSRGPMFSELR